MSYHSCTEIWKASYGPREDFWAKRTEHTPISRKRMRANSKGDAIYGTTLGAAIGAPLTYTMIRRGEPEWIANKKALSLAAGTAFMAGLGAGVEVASGRVSDRAHNKRVARRRDRLDYIRTRVSKAGLGAVVNPVRNELNKPENQKKVKTQLRQVNNKVAREMPKLQKVIAQPTAMMKPPKPQTMPQPPKPPKPQQISKAHKEQARQLRILGRRERAGRAGKRAVNAGVAGGAAGGLIGGAVALGTKQPAKLRYAGNAAAWGAGLSSAAGAIEQGMSDTSYNRAARRFNARQGVRR